MSDISINLDGVLAFLAAAALALGLLLGLLMGALSGWAQSHRQPARFTQQRVFPHLVGMALSLVGSVVVLLLLWAEDGTLPPHSLALWLDQWLWLWVPGIVALWPGAVYGWKQWRAAHCAR